jgi:hypothetical protein
VNRRSFLSSFVKGAVIWTAAPQIVTHGLGLVKGRRHLLSVANPDYETAPYEYIVFYEDGTLDDSPYKMRFRLVNGVFTAVPPFIPA